MNLKNLKKHIILISGFIVSLILIILLADLLVFLTGYKSLYYSENLTIRKSHWSSKEQLYSDFLDKPVSPLVDKILENNQDSLVPYKEGRWFGYFSLLSGNKVIDESKYHIDFAFPFSQDLAAVVIRDTIKFIDRTGRFVFTTKINLPILIKL